MNDCPRCGGFGDIFDTTYHGEEEITRRIPCPDCNGRGWICHEDHEHCPNRYRCDIGGKNVS